MALETFKAQIKAKALALKANLSQNRINAIADRLHKKFPDLTEVADHDSKIDDFNDLQPLTDIAKGDDHVRTLEAKAKGQAAEPEEPADPAEEGDKGKTGNNKKKAAAEVPEWAKGLLDEVKALRSEKTQTTMKDKLSTMLKDVVPASYYNGRTLPEKEEDLETFVETIKTDYTTFKQDLVNQGLMSATPPVGGSGGNVSDKVFEASVDAFVADKKGPTTTTK